jgi:hypothetical protein
VKAIGSDRSRIGGEEDMRTGKFNGRDNLRGAVVAMVACGLWLAPVASQAKDKRKGDPTFATLQLYEVLEGTDLKGNPPALRLANAALVGKSSGGVCTAGQDPCDFNTLATSHVPFDTGVGPIKGDFQVLFDTLLNPGHLLSDLVVKATGSIDGTLDLRPLLSGTQPLAFMNGKWKSKDIGVRGTFTGTFFVPTTTIPEDAGGSDLCPETHFAYFDDSGNHLCLTITEFSLGRPVTKVLATFVKTGAIGPGDKDDDADEHGKN